MNLKILILTLFTLPLLGQEFSVELSADTILAGNVLNVTFTARNISGQFEGPDLNGLTVIGGPNTSTSMTMINGDVSQTATYSYSILCEDIGVITVLPGYLDAGDETFETDPISVLVLPNPEGIIEQPPSQSGFFEFGFPNKTKPKSKSTSKSKKKKRKLKRI